MRLACRRFHNFAELPAAYDALRARLAQAGLFGEPAWFELLMTLGFDPSDRMFVFAVEAADGRPLLLAPLRFGRHDGAARGALVLASVSHTENFAPAAIALDPSLDEAQSATVIATLLRGLRNGDPALTEAPVDLVRLWPMAEGSPYARLLEHAVREAGFIAQVYANSYNRYEDVAGLSHAQYFAQRSANLRYSVRRRRRALERDGGLTLELVRGGDALEPAIADYVMVSLKSWKRPSTTVADEIIGMMRLASSRGALRLGLLRLHGVPVAVQFWLVNAGVAHCVRLSYDESYKKAAAGIVLTDYMIEQVLDGDRVARLDFGYGREGYKASWMRQGQVHAGVLGFSPRSWRGRWEVLRHIGGQPAKRFAKALLLRLGLRKPADDEDGREE